MRKYVAHLLLDGGRIRDADKAEVPRFAAPHRAAIIIVRKKQVAGAVFVVVASQAANVVRF
jgi:hypothetical protein